MTRSMRNEQLKSASLPMKLDSPHSTRAPPSIQLGSSLLQKKENLKLEIKEKEKEISTEEKIRDSNGEEVNYLLFTYVISLF